MCVNGTLCTKLCDPNNPSGACGSKYGCMNAGNGKHVCFGNPGTPNPVVDEGGCEVAPAGPGQLGNEHFLLRILALPILLMLRRRR